MPCGSQGRYAPRASRTVAKPNASEFPNGRFHDREAGSFRNTLFPLGKTQLLAIG